MKRRAVTVHQDHGGGKVETARHQYTDGGFGVEGLAGHRARRVEVVTAFGQHQDGEERHRHDPRHADNGHTALKNFRLVTYFLKATNNQKQLINY